MVQPAFPFSILDYGLAAALVVVTGLIVYLFIRFLSNHMSKVTRVLEDLVDCSRGMRDEFFRLTSEVRDMEGDFEDLTSELKQRRE